MVKKAVILAGGFGTRFLPASYSVPKEMFVLAGKPALMYILEECRLSNINDIVIIINPEKASIKKLFKPNKRLEKRLIKTENLHLLDELYKINRELKIRFYIDRKINGSGGVVESAKRLIGNEPFVLIFGDDYFAFDKDTKPAAFQLVNTFLKDETRLVVGAKRVHSKLLSRYGVCKLGKKLSVNTFLLNGFVEKPKADPPSDVCGLGRYVIPKDWAQYIKQVKPKNYEKQITDMFDLYIKENRAVVQLLDNTRYDLGSKLGYAIASNEVALQNPELADLLKDYLKNLVANDCKVLNNQVIFDE